MIDFLVCCVVLVALLAVKLGKTLFLLGAIWATSFSAKWMRER